MTSILITLCFLTPILVCVFYIIESGIDEKKRKAGRKMKLWEIFLKPSSLLLGMVEAIDALNAVLIAVKIWEEPEEMLTAVEYRPEFYATKGVNYVESKEILSNRHKRRID